MLTSIAPSRQLYVLVDNDREGRALYKNGKLDGGGRWIEHRSNGAWWCRLPWTADFSEVMKELGVPQDAWPGSLENIFSPELRALAALEGAYRVGTDPHQELIEGGNFKRIVNVFLDADDRRRFYVCGPTSDMKVQFADWVVDKGVADAAILEPLRPVIEGLSALVSTGS